MKPAYILGGYEVGMGIIRSLSARKIPIILFHYKDDDFAPFSKYLVHNEIVPHPGQAEAECINQLLKTQERYGRGVLFPVSDEALVAVSKNLNKLGNYFNIACSDWEITQKFIEKKYTYELADNIGLAAPKSITVRNIEEIRSLKSSMVYPCLLKPSQSHLFVQTFNVKMQPVANEEELISAYGKISGSGLDIMLQEIIPGDDTSVVNYNAIFWKGKPLVEFTAQQIRKAPPKWGSPRIVLSKKIDEVIDPGRKILKAMNFHGYACVELKKDKRDGIYKLIEINGRHNLSTTLAIRCGIDFPFLHYCLLLEQPVSLPEEFEENVFWIDIVRDILNGLKYFTKEHYTLSTYVKPYFKPKTFAILSFDDLKPFLMRWRFVFRQFGRRIMK